MRTEAEMMELILGAARRDDRIRAVYMNGSRANPDAPRDIFQDYDIVYVVRATAPFLADPAWVDVFGRRLIMQQPDEMDRLLGKEADFTRSYAYLMQFWDGSRIDLTLKLWDEADYRADRLTVPLLDKDGLLPEIPPPSDEDYRVKRPSQALFLRCVNEFWWVAPYAAKGLWRGEILYALEHLDRWLRDELLTMLSWRAGAGTGFPVSVGKAHKYLEKHLEPGLWQRLMRTYPRGETEAVWNALLEMSLLFRDAAKETAAALGFPHDAEEAESVLAYLAHVRSLPKDAEHIR